MSRYAWSSRFETWASPLSDTADEKCQNAESVIRGAITADSSLTNLEIRVYAQGSYKANTNVRADSDVDICVENKATFFYEMPPNMTPQNAGFVSGQGMQFSDFKNMVGSALYNRLGYLNVERGNKAFKVKENTYRIQADVVPTFTYRRYYWQGSAPIFVSGVCLFTDAGEKIVNWPEHTLANGRVKNQKTGWRYKKVVRVLKGLRYEMESNGSLSAKKVSSFQIACLAYNVSNGFYGKDDLYDDVKEVVSQIWFHMTDSAHCGAWTEVDEIKPLITSDQKRLECKDFFWDLMQYAGLS